MAETSWKRGSGLQSSTASSNPAAESIVAVYEPSHLSRNWQERLEVIVETMREMSRQTDPQAMVAAYGRRMRTLIPADRWLSLSRRDLAEPHFRVTRYSGWDEEINPWKSPERLPLLQGGLVADLIYGDEPLIINDLDVDLDDPAFDFLSGMRSLMAIPLYDSGVALNMVLSLKEAPEGFHHEQFPEIVQTSNLFGRATSNLVLADRLETAYETVDQELKAVADIQTSLLPETLPNIPTMGLAADYRTARRAGGDYYDFFALPEGRWGILIADVSGHGTPAAVLMAVTHSIAHMYPGPATSPAKFLRFLNEQLCRRYTEKSGMFVTAFYGVYNADVRTLAYASAGHNPPRLKRCSCGTVFSLDGVGNVPLGVTDDTQYGECSEQLFPGDRILFYTDGIVESQSRTGELFGVGLLDEVLTDCESSEQQLLTKLLTRIEEFTAGSPAIDDRTLLVADIR